MESEPPLHITQRVGVACLATALIAVAWRMLSAAPVVSPDSLGYILGAYCRSPLLPLIFRALRPLFGDGALRAMIVLQSLAILGAGAALARILLTCGLCGRAAALFVALAVAALGSIFSSFVLSEALCYAVAIAYFGRLIALTQNGKPLDSLFALVFLGMLGRPQMIWLIVPQNVCACFQALHERRLWPALRSVIASLAVIAAALFSAMAYNAATLGHFAYTSMGGVHLFGNALYLSNESDSALFADDPKREAFFLDILAEADRHRMRFKYWNNGYTPGGFFREYYAGETTFLYLTEFSLGTKHGLNEFDRPHEPEALRDISLVRFDAVCMQMAAKLILHNPIGYAKHIFRKLMATRMPLALAALLLCVVAARDAMRRGDPLAEATAGTALCLLANYLMLGLGNIVYSRYALASEVPFFIVTGLYVLRLQALAPALPRPAPPGPRR